MRKSFTLILLLAMAWECVLADQAEQPQPQGKWLVLDSDGLEFLFQARDTELATRLWPLMQDDRHSIMSELRLFPAGVLRVKLLPTSQDFQAEIPPGAPGDALGLYSPASRTLFLRAPRSLSGSYWDLRGVMRHELVHGVLDLALEVPVPLWLHEGLAILVAHELSYLDDAGLNARAVFGGLIPLSRLIAGFPADPAGRGQAYSQAASFVRFLLARNGMTGLHDLLREMDSGKDVFRAFSTVYGENLPTLENEWRDGLTVRFSWWTLLSASSLFVLIGTPLILAGALRRHLEKKKRLTQMVLQEEIEQALQEQKDRPLN
ncbi:MAG: peptidase MA family metallohydrolase [Deltaproteobacteria bacterium]|nr:peptidase MA family metallohydrolase [Deltaproteobacteria bacterium]